MDISAINSEPPQPPPLPLHVSPVKAASNDLDAWLNSIGMQQYSELFKRHHIGFAECAKLSDADLQSMGIELVGHRKVIQEGIEKLQTQETDKIREATRQQINAHVNKWLLRLGIAWALFSLALGVIGGIGAAAEALSKGESFVKVVSYIVLGPLFIGLIGMLAYLLLLGYLWPSTMAFRKNNPFRWFILVLNCLFGLTGIAWLGLLAFAWMVDGTDV